MNHQGHSPERRRLLRWLGAAVLVFPVALSACANSGGSTHYGRSSSDIRGSDHRGGQSDYVNILGRSYSF
jgi:hypothetical protein